MGTVRQPALSRTLLLCGDVGSCYGKFVDHNRQMSVRNEGADVHWDLGHCSSSERDSVDLKIVRRRRRCRSSRCYRLTTTCILVADPVVSLSCSNNASTSTVHL